MEVFLGVLIGALLVVVAGAALFAFSWSPLRGLIADEASAPGGGYRSEPAPPAGGRLRQWRADDLARARRGVLGQRVQGDLGTIEVPEDSILRWTTTEDSVGSARSFAVMDRDFRINVSVQGRPSGQSPVDAGV